jgi:Fe-S cluster assembly protein SufD
MDKPGKITPERLTGLFDEHRALICSDGNNILENTRVLAMEAFRLKGFPAPKEESWRHTDLRETLERNYAYHLTPKEEGDVMRVFRCDIPHLETAVLGQLNGWYVSKDVPLMVLGNGIIMGSLAEAMRKFPELVESHLGKYSAEGRSGFADLNTAFAMDGVFIYVPDNVTGNKAVQLVNVIQSQENIFLQSRNLVVLGKNSRLTLVHCDDSYDHQPSFTNNVMEVFMDAGAVMDHYKLQNLNNNSTLISSSFFHLEAAANLESHYLSLNGGLLRNNTHVTFNGPRGNADIYGLYLMDKKQHVDNHVFIDHAVPDCTSTEHFKGIMDEHATGVFNGHVLVRRNAARTNAYQSNRNILLTDTARVHSKPFLEIYNDDVKCSHGSTTGQLDQEAMFYLRQRGIGEESARMLLMYAFADEIVSKIRIGPLRYRIEDMIKKRLQGELQICEQCVLHCNNPEHPTDFIIDLTRI